MNHAKFLCIAMAMTCTSGIHAGGLLTNTNQNIAFNRNMARDGAIGIDGVYSNPAGVAFMSNGLHLSFNFQNVYQTRVVQSGITVPALQNTPYYQPFKLNGGDANGIKEFKGKASVPILPSFQAALNYDKWGFQVGFALNGGGGRATFNNGLGAFEREIAMIPVLLHSQGFTTAAPSYGVNSYISGQQYVFGVQLGSTYKINEYMAAYAGLRFNYVWNKYEGSITDISANINGNNEKLHTYFSKQAKTYEDMSFYYKMRATEITDPATKAQYEQMAARYAAGAEKLSKTGENFADKHLDCTQEGWGVTPIIGFDFKYGRWNVGTRLEFNTRLNIENHTKHDDTGRFKGGVNTPNDLPGIWTLGAQYSVLPNLRVMGSYHYYFDKSAKMANDRQKKLSSNTQEFLAGAEWDITKDVLVSAGVQRTRYGLGDGGYLNDMSFVTSSYSVGLGASFRIMKNARMNVAYFWTNYEHFDKSYTAKVGGMDVVNTDNFYRTNKVFGVGLDIDI